MIITPTLHFHGNCEEAIALYQKAFHCKVDILLHYSDADKRDLGSELSEDQKKLVMHSEILFGDQRIRMSDGLAADNVQVTSIFIAISFETSGEVRKAFDVIKNAGGIVIEPLHNTTYSSCMGSIIDKYGFRWRLMTEQTEL